MSIKSIGTVALLISVNCAMARADDKDSKHEQPPELNQAVCVLIPTMGNKVRGRILFSQSKDGTTRVRGRVNNLSPGLHGFHIHQYGDLTDRTGKSAGGHFNPDGHDHAGPDSVKRHAGDLGNIEANDDGVAQVDVSVKGLKVHFVLGRSIVVHGGKDDLKSQPSGDAGPRVAVGVIGIQQPTVDKK